MEDKLLEIIGAIVVAIIGLGVTYATAWIRHRFKNEKLADAAEQIGKAVMISVKEAEQTIRPMLKDGKLDDQEKAGIRTTVIGNAKKRITPAALKILEDSVSDFNDYMNSQVEAAVHDLKKEGGQPC